MTIRWLIFGTIVGALAARCAFGQDWKPDVKRLSLEVYHVGMFADPYFDSHQDSNQQYNKGVALLWDVALTKGLYWDNRVWTIGDNAKVQAVGWEWDLFFRPIKEVDLFYRHHSQHLMDDAGPLILSNDNPLETTPAHYPLRDFFGVRINFTPEGRKGGLW